MKSYICLLLYVKDTEGNGRVRLSLCSREDLDDLLIFITEHCDVTSPSEEVPILPCTGGGSQEHREKITKTLNVKLVDEYNLS